MFLFDTEAMIAVRYEEIVNKECRFDMNGGKSVKIVTTQAGRND